MDRYTLSNEGRAKFARRKASANLGLDTIEGYEVIDCLFENGSATVEDIMKYTGLSWEQVVNKLSDFIHWGYAEELSSPQVFFKGKS